MTPYVAAQLAEPHPPAEGRTPLAAPLPTVSEGRVTPLLPAVPVALQRRHSDAWLVARVGRLRPDPFDVLFERHWADVHAYCRRILGSADDGQDCAQDAMMRAYQRLWRTKDAPPFRPLVFAIARNASIDRLRERRRDGGPVEEHHVAAAAGADELAADRSRVDLLVDDLRGLSSRQRTALVLREASGLSHSDIAATLDTTPARVKSLISEARQALAERRAGRDLTCEDYNRAARVRGRGRGRGQNQRLLAHRAICARCGEAPLTVHVLGLPALALAWPLRVARHALRAVGSVGAAPAGAKLAVGLACMATASVPVVRTLGVADSGRARAVAFGQPAAAAAASTASPATEHEIGGGVRHTEPVLRAAAGAHARATGETFRQTRRVMPAVVRTGDRSGETRPYSATAAVNTVATPLVHSGRLAVGRVRRVVQDVVAGGDRLRSQVVWRVEKEISAANPTLASATVIRTVGAVAPQLTKANPGRPGDAKPGISVAEIAQLPKGATS